MLFAIRETTEPDPHLQALPRSPARRPTGAGCVRAARRPLSTDRSTPTWRSASSPGPGGNPLAMVEAARELTPEQLRGQVPLLEPMPVGHQLEDLFVRRVRELPTETQTLLLLGAAEQPGRGDRLWRAAATLGITESAAAPAEAARNGDLLAGGAILPPAPPLGGLPLRDSGSVSRGTPGPRGGLRPAARRSSPGLASGGGRRWARRTGRGLAGGGSRTGQGPRWLCRRGRTPGTCGAADPRRGAAGRTAPVSSGGPRVRGVGRPSRGPADRSHQVPARSAVDRAGHPTGGQDPVPPGARGRGHLRPGLFGTTIEAARPPCR